MKQGYKSSQIDAVNGEKFKQKALHSKRLADKNFKNPLKSAITKQKPDSDMKFHRPEFGSHAKPAHEQDFLSFLKLSEGRDAARIGFVTYLVSIATGVEARAIGSRTRNCAEAARARQIAMYLTHVGFSWTMGRVGAAFGRDRSTASYACHIVEDLRDHPGFDAIIENLETCMRVVVFDCEDKALS